MTSDLEARIAALEEQVKVTQTVYYKSNAAPATSTTTTMVNTTVENPFTITFITAVTVDSGTAAKAWTTYSAAASIPTTARYVVLTCFGTDEVGVAGDTYIKYRKNSSSPELMGLYCFINAGVGDVSGTNTRIVPVINQGFDYYLNLGFTNGWEILLEGYIL